MTDKELYDFTVDQAVRLTDSEIGFLHLISDDQETVFLTTWNGETKRQCALAHEIHYPTQQAGNWLDSARLNRPVVYNDFPNSPNQKGLPTGHVGVRRFMSIPILEDDKVSMVFGVGNKADPYDDHDVVQLQLVANELSKLLRQRRSEAACRESEAKLQAMQLQLAHVARLSSMGEMAAGIAHELGQPLFAIVNYAKAAKNLLSRTEALDTDGVRECVGKIAEIAAAAGSIGKRMQLFAKHTEQDRCACDIQEVVGEAIALVTFEARREKVRVETEPAQNKAVAWANRIEIQQVLVNLLRNAFDAMEYTPLGLRRVQVQTAIGDGVVEISVSDCGVGLPNDPQVRIFDAFATTKREGLGMGLTISSTIVDNHGGKLWATRQPEGGACFHFQLPLHSGGPEHAQ